MRHQTLLTNILDIFDYLDTLHTYLDLAEILLKVVKDLVPVKYWRDNRFYNFNNSR